ncbi:hypothetical protein [Mycobacterium avium]|uniref:hypothetical protein n=1 Tax=Mycobacterium avium TaxID=1764 RepID=UPI000AC8E3EF|nr:hypothetical protein [Mycobacterium avium]
MVAFDADAPLMSTRKSFRFVHAGPSRAQPRRERQAEIHVIGVARQPKTRILLRLGARHAINYTTTTITEVTTPTL